MPADKTLAEAIASPSGTVLEFLGMKPKEGEPAYREGYKAEHEHGLLYCAPWQVYADGFCEHSRRSVRAVAATGVPTLLRGLGYYQDTDPEARAAIEPLLSTSIARPSVSVQQVVYTDDAVRRALLPRFPLSAEELARLRSAIVISTVLERDRISQRGAALLATAAQVWGAASATLDALERSGVPREKLRLIRCPYFPDDPHLPLRGRQRTRGRPVLYAIGKWEPRKDQHRMLLTFFRAFKPGEARLILRSNALARRVANYPLSPAESLAIWSKDERVIANGWTADKMYDDVSWIATRLDDRSMLSLHAIGDVYVSMSHGEGFDMPGLDAKLSGNRMIYTPSGGPEEYASHSDVRVARSGDAPCHPMYRWNPDAKWLDYDGDQAVEAMRAVIQNLPQKHEPDIDLRRFTAEAVGAKMRACIEEVVAAHGGKLA
jgi:hypothetical protein